MGGVKSLNRLLIRTSSMEAFMYFKHRSMRTVVGIAYVPYFNILVFDASFGQVYHI